MRKQLRSLAAAALVAVVFAPEAHSQVVGLIGGARFKVVSPSYLQGSRRFTFAGYSTSGGEWGGDLSTPIINVPLVQAIGNGNGNTDTLLCTPAANGTGAIPSLAGKVAILYRGDCQFSEKALLAQNAGAVAAVIVNNIPGNPVPMGAGTSSAGVSIPVFMLSDVDGRALMNSVRNDANTRVTLLKWGEGQASDIGVITDFNATYHGGAIPRKQLAASNGNPYQYRMYTGDVVANFGTDSARDMVLTREVRWTPSGSSSYTVLNSDTAQLPFLAPIDSVELLFNNRFYNPHATTNGVFTLYNRLTSSQTDPDTLDNINQYRVHVTDSIYSKGAWDMANNRPAYTGAYRLSSGSIFTWGPLFHTAVGGEYPSRLQFSVSPGENESLLGESVTTTAFRFDDGANGNPRDGIFQDGELTLIALGFKQFSAADTASPLHLSVPFDPSQSPSPMPKLASNATYWYGVSPSIGTIFIGANSGENPYMRTLISKRVDTIQYYAPQFFGSSSLITSGGVSNSDFHMLSFISGTNNIDSVSVNQTSGIPAMALHVSADQPSSVRTASASVIKSFEVFPNPAQNDLNIRWSAKEAFGVATITVFNGVGQPVTNFKTSDLNGNVKLSLSQLPSGTYWVVFGSEKGVDSRQLKIVK